jgi:hypothetical protein
MSSYRNWRASRESRLGCPWQLRHKPHIGGRINRLPAKRMGMTPKRSAPVRIAHLSEIEVFETDCLPSAAIFDLCQRCDVKVIEVRGPEEADGADI